MQFLKSKNADLPEMNCCARWRNIVICQKILRFFYEKLIIPFHNKQKKNTGMKIEVKRKFCLPLTDAVENRRKIMFSPKAKQSYHPPLLQ